MCEENHADDHHGSEIYILRLDKGEEIVSSLVEFCKENEILGAWVQGIGAVESATLALYDLGNKEYHNKDLDGPLEIANLVGNIGTHKGEVTAHLHATLGDKDMKAYAGHLSKAIVAATCEIRLEPLDIELKRKHNKEIGLNLINI